MDERAEVDRQRLDQDEIERYLDKVLKELEALPDYAQDWDPVDPTDEQDTYASEWASVAYGRMDRLEQSYVQGRMDATQNKRYAAIKELFKARLPLIERYSLDVPRVPLD